MDMILECQKQVHKNSTCKDLDDKIQEGLADMNMCINLFKGLLSPFCLILLGSLSDMIGKKHPIIFVLFINLLWASISLVNTFYITTFPPWMFIVQSGVLSGIMGGSNSTMYTLQMAYVALVTPVNKRASRFSTLLGVGLMGFFFGLLISGAMMSKNMFVEISVIASGTGMIIFIIALITLKRPDRGTRVEESYARMCQNQTFCRKMILSVNLQLKNFKDLFVTSDNVPALVTIIIIFLFTHLGQICPLDTIAGVYSLGDPFNWSPQFRSYYGSGVLLLLAIQSSLTLKLLEMMKLSRIAITRFGIFMGFVGSFFLALATVTYTLIIGVAISTFIIVANPNIQSITTSLVKESQIGCIFGLLGAVQSIAESGLINVVLLVYTKTRNMMNGFCFFVVSFLLGINLVLAMFYQHPTVNREDSYIGLPHPEQEEKLLSEKSA